MYHFQMIWVCILCRKKQELMIKTGSWMQATTPSSGADDPILRKMEADLQHSSSYVTSAAAGATTPLRQYSTQFSLDGSSSLAATAAGRTTGSGGLTGLFSRAMSIAGTPSSSTAPKQPTFGGGGTSGSIGGFTGLFGLSSSTASTANNTPTHTPTGGSSGSAGGIGLGLSGLGSRGRFERAASLDRSGMFGMTSSGVGATSAATSLGVTSHSTTYLSPRLHSSGALGGSGRLPRQRSLESSESLSPAGPPSTRRFPASSASALRSSAYLTTRTSLDEPDPLSRFYHSRAPTGARSRTGAVMSRGVSLGSSSAPYLASSSSYHSGGIGGRSALGRSLGTGSGYLSASAGITGRRSDSRFLLDTASAPEDVDIGPTTTSSLLTGRIGGTSALDTGVGGRDLYPRVLVSDSEARDLCPPLPLGERDVLSDHAVMGMPRTSVASAGLAGRTFTRRKLDSAFRNDSLSSDQSECLQQSRPPPPKPHKSKRRLPSTTGMRQSGHAAATVASAAAHAARAAAAARRRRAAAAATGHGGSSFASSSEDDEIRSTPDYTSCGEEMESESISEKGKY